MCNGGAKGGRQFRWILWIVMDGSPIIMWMEPMWVKIMEVGEQNDYIQGFCRFRCGMVFSSKGIVVERPNWISFKGKTL